MSHCACGCDTGKAVSFVCSCLHVCTPQTLRLTPHSLTVSHCWTALSLHITWMMLLISSYNIHKLQLTISQRRCEITVSLGHYESRDFRWRLSFISSFLAFWAGGSVSWLVCCLIFLRRGSGGGNVTMCANHTSLKHMQPNLQFLHASARTLRNCYDIRVPIPYQIW